MKIRTSLKGLKKWAWRKNLKGFFSIEGRELSDAEVRKMVDWAINKGYECDVDVPAQDVIELLGWNKSKCLRDRSKICNQCHECDVDVLNPRY